MSRFFLVLISAMMMSAAFAGCFGDDDDDPEDTGNGGNGGPPGNNNTTDPPGGNNTTQEPTVAPTPAFTVSMATFDAEGGEVSNETGTNFTASPNGNVSFTFDGSASTDEDGAIEAFSWRVIAPDGKEFTNAGAQVSFQVPKLSGSDFGAYKGILKVLDDDNVLNSAEFFVVLNYATTFEAAGGMTGPGTSACTDPREEKAGSEVEGTGVTPGTFGMHRVTLGDNASKIEVTLTYVSGAAPTTMAMYLLAPDAAEDACATAIATAESGASPLTISVGEGIDVAGGYQIRVELDGVSVTSYTVDVGVTYSVPTQTVDDEAEPPAEG